MTNALGIAVTFEYVKREEWLAVVEAMTKVWSLMWPLSRVTRWVEVNALNERRDNVVADEDKVG